MERFRLLSHAAATEPIYIGTLALTFGLCVAGGFFLQGVVSTGEPAFDLAIPTWALMMVLGQIHSLVMLNTVFERRFSGGEESAEKPSGENANST